MPLDRPRPKAFALVVGLVAVVACAAPERPPAAATASAAKARPPEDVVVGRVVGPDGRPIASALVAAFAPLAERDERSRPFEVVRADADGGFRVRRRPGPFTLSAASPDGSAASLAASGDARPGPLVLALDARGPLLRGVVRGPGDAACVGAAVRVAATAGVFAVETRTDAEGRYALRLPPGAYYVIADDGVAGHEPIFERIRLDRDRDVDLDVVRSPRPPTSSRAAFVAWLGSRAVAVGLEPGEETRADAGALRGLIGDARIVALGEPTHGTHELARFRHRALELLASDGFTIAAFETGFAEAVAVDAFVRQGEGTARAAVAGLAMWPWDTEELVAQIGWMRRYDADPRRARKIGFAGVDVSSSTRSIPVVIDYLARHDPAAADRARRLFAPFDGAFLAPTYARLTPAAAAAHTAGLAALAETLDAGRARFVDRSGPDAWADAAQHLRVLRQADALAHAGADRGELRDRFMAENALWLLERHPGARVLLTAHIGHATFVHDLRHAMGMHLRARLGPGYLAIGALVGGGRFLSHGVHDPTAPTLDVREVGSPSPTSLEAALAEVGAEAFLVDVRGATGSGADWFDGWTTTRQAGTLGADIAEVPVVVARSFDALLFVARSHPTRPTPAAVRRYGERR